MLFNSYEFLLFFPIVSIIYFLLPQKIKNYWLLISSYIFYMNWNVEYSLLLLFSTLVTYISGIMIEYFRNKYPENKNILKVCVACSCILNILLLVYFKYVNLIISTLSLLGSKSGLWQPLSPLEVILPVGISFYIFQALSYTMDAYKGDVEIEHNFFQYALFVSFFPQLVAGPIERSSHLLKQFKQRHCFSYANMRDGLLLMLWGYFMKLVIADRIAIYVDHVYGDIERYPGAYLVVASLLFAIQIYCDFNGYSMIAIGCAKVMGFSLMENFNCPYFSKSCAEFWRRWHISLSSWFKDYLYIPLGGSKEGTIRQCLNLLIVFCVSGLWHGAAISFIIWGAINGIYQIVGKFTRKIRISICNKIKLNRESFGHKAAQVLLTFLLIDFTWIFFRADSFSHGIKIIKSIVFTNNWNILTDDSLLELGLDWKNWVLLIAAFCILTIVDIIKYKGYSVREFIYKQDLWFRWLFYLISLASIMIFGIWGTGYDGSAFIYFQF